MFSRGDLFKEYTYLIVSMLAIFFNHNHAHSQSFERLIKGDFNSNYYSGSGNDIIQWPDSTYLVLGNIHNSDLFPRVDQHFSHLLKLDVNGNLLWSKISTSEKYLSRFIRTSDNKLVFLGSINHFNNFRGDVLIAKTDSAGNVKFLNSKIYGLKNSKTSEGCGSIVETFDGGFITVGYYSAGDMDQEKKTKALILRLNSNLGLVWSRVIGDTNNIYASAVIKSKDGGYIVAGSTDEYDYDWSKGFLLKINDQGAVIWTKIFESSGKTNLTSILEIGGDSLYLGGYSDSGIVVVKCDQNGIIDWSKEFRASDTSLSLGGFSLSVLADSSLVLYGTIFGYGSDVFMLRIDVQGNAIIGRSYSGPGATTTCNKAISTLDTGLIITGTSSLPYPLASNRLMYITKIDSKGDAKCRTQNLMVRSSNFNFTVLDTLFPVFSGIDNGSSGLGYKEDDVNFMDACGPLAIEETLIDQEPLFYPNPASDFVYYNSDKIFSTDSYKIFTIDGRFIRQGLMEGRKIDLKDIKDGMYIIKLNSGSNGIIQKLVSDRN